MTDPIRGRKYELLPGFEYNELIARQIAQWWPKYLRHTKGPWYGKPFHLVEWQRVPIQRLFATVNKHGHRQYRHIFLGVPKKTGKTELGAGVGIRILCADGQHRPEVYSAASDQEQAGICFGVASTMVKLSPPLSKRLKLTESTKRMRHLRNWGEFRALSSEKKGKQGYSPSCVLFDELHEQPDRILWDGLTSRQATMARESPVIFTMTTAGEDKDSIGYEVWDRMLAIQEGKHRDPTSLPFIWAAEDEADWLSPKVWQGCNPAWNITIKPSEVALDAAEAEVNVELETRFRQWRLNQWTDGLVRRWIPMQDWDKCRGVPEMGEMMVYGGLDLGSVDGIASLARIRLTPDGFMHVDIRSWAPEKRIQEQARLGTTGTKWEDWVREGWLCPTRGNLGASTDEDAILADIVELHKEVKFDSIGLAKWTATELGTALEGNGIEPWEIPMTCAAQNEACRSLFRRVTGCTLIHDGNPHLRTAAVETKVRSDGNGFIRPDKEESKGSIEPIAALVCALDRQIRSEGPAVPYKDRPGGPRAAAKKANLAVGIRTRQW